MQVTPLISELGRTRMEVNAKVKAGFGAKDFALNVVITIPVPDTTAKADIHTSIGAAYRLPFSASCSKCIAVQLRGSTLGLHDAAPCHGLGSG